jgi:hypothetical protein
MLTAPVGREGATGCSALCSALGGQFHGSVVNLAKMWQTIGVLAELERSLMSEWNRAGVKAARISPYQALCSLKETRTK